MIQTERLTEEQILKLLDRYRRARDPRAREKLVLQYSNLVESIARRFAGAGEPVEDMAQEGYMGLISALDGFDVSKGVKFSTYATHFVIGQIKHYLRDKVKIIKEPAWLQELNQRMTRAMDQLSQEFGRQPTESEIAEAMGIPDEDVRALLTTREVFKVSSLDGDREDSSGGGVAEKAKRQKYEALELPVEDRMVLEQAVERLKSIEQHVIYEYFFKELNQTEIARKLGISCNYVSHILRNSTKKLKKILTTEDIKEVQMRLRALHKRGVADTASAMGGITDPATGVYTRGYFLQRLEEEISRGARHGYPVGAMLLTLEYMSDRRQGWAPLTTDERLYLIGQSIRERVRRADIVARYSDNQFALVLPHTGSAGEKVCERIMQVIANIKDELPGDLLEVRGTLRFATYPDQASTFNDLIDLIESGQSLIGEPETELPMAA